MSFTNNCMFIKPIILFIINKLIIVKFAGMEEDFIKINCEYCDIDFYVIGRNRKFCSKECRELYSKNVNKKESENIYNLPIKLPHKKPSDSKQIKLLKRLVYCAKTRAQKNNLPFNITCHDLQIPKFCPLLGVPLKVEKVGFKDRNFAPSIDKIIPELGYIKGNVWIISYKANLIKNNLKPDELIYLANALLEKFTPLHQTTNIEPPAQIS